MLEKLIERLKDKKILILGFGREGRSTYAFISEFLPGQKVSIADKKPETLKDVKENNNVDECLSGDGYLVSLEDFDLIILSPGIPSPKGIDAGKITSQTALFLEFFGHQTIGVTGTKGKSTTSSLIQHILGKAGKPVFLGGNIGKPPFDILPEKNEANATFVLEISSHQLEQITQGPATAVLLNLFPEHLDRYGSSDLYYSAKWNITAKQKEGDLLILNRDDEEIRSLLARKGTPATIQYFSGQNKVTNGLVNKDSLICEYESGKAVNSYPQPELKGLKGKHNLKNIFAALLVAKNHGVELVDSLKYLDDFKGLPHRLEYLGKLGGIHFYNDSIATIPEAALSAIETLEKVDTIILGGYDRNLDYSALVNKIMMSGIDNAILTGQAGRRMHSSLIQSGYSGNIFFVERLKDSFKIIPEYTPENGICLLSPAAASYDQFRDFEERGNLFASLARSLE